MAAQVKKQNKYNSKLKALELLQLALISDAVAETKCLRRCDKAQYIIPENWDNKKENTIYSYECHNLWEIKPNLNGFQNVAFFFLFIQIQNPSMLMNPLFHNWK